MSYLIGPIIFGGLTFLSKQYFDSNIAFTPINLLDVPIEVVMTHIIPCLDYQSVIHFLQTCKTYRKEARPYFISCLEKFESWGSYGVMNSLIATMVYYKLPKYLNCIKSSYFGAFRQMNKIDYLDLCEKEKSQLFVSLDDYTSDPQITIYYPFAVFETIKNIHEKQPLDKECTHTDNCRCCDCIFGKVDTFLKNI